MIVSEIICSRSDAVDDDLQVLAAGGEDLLVQQRVARVLADAVQRSRAPASGSAGCRSSPGGRRSPRPAGPRRSGLARSSCSNELNPPSASRRGATLISMLNWPSSVWNDGSAIAASTSALRIAGSHVVVDEVELDLQPGHRPLEVEPRLGQHPGEHVQARADLLAVPLAVLAGELLASTSAPMALSWPILHVGDQSGGRPRRLVHRARPSPGRPDPPGRPAPARRSGPPRRPVRRLRVAAGQGRPGDDRPPRGRERLHRGPDRPPRRPARGRSSTRSRPARWRPTCRCRARRPPRRLASGTTAAPSRASSTASTAAAPATDRLDPAGPSTAEIAGRGGAARRQRRPRATSSSPSAPSALSPDGRLLAFTTDTVGDERFTLQVKDLRTGELLPDQIADTGVRRDLGPAGRAPLLHHRRRRLAPAQGLAAPARHRPGRRRAGPPRARRAVLGRGRPHPHERCLVIGVGSKLTTRVPPARRRRPRRASRGCVAPRRQGVEYAVEPAGRPPAGPAQRRRRELRARRGAVRRHHPRAVATAAAARPGVRLSRTSTRSPATSSSASAATA